MKRSAKGRVALMYQFKKRGCAFLTRLQSDHCCRPQFLNLLLMIKSQSHSFAKANSSERLLVTGTIQSTNMCSCACTEQKMTECSKSMKITTQISLINQQVFKIFLEKQKNFQTEKIIAFIIISPMQNVVLSYCGSINIRIFYYIFYFHFYLLFSVYY